MYQCEYWSVEYKTTPAVSHGYFEWNHALFMTNIEAFAHIIDLANRTTDKATYDYLMKEAQEIMSDPKSEEISYCDFAELVKERLNSQSLRAK